MQSPYRGREVGAGVLRGPGAGLPPRHNYFLFTSVSSSSGKGYLSVINLAFISCVTNHSSGFQM